MTTPNIAILIDLARGESAGGHVKIWEKLMRAAAQSNLPAHFTLYTLAEAACEENWGERVRLVGLPPMQSTEQSRLTQTSAGETDLAAFHPLLAARLREHDLLHITSLFSFARTAARVARQKKIPLLFSFHSDMQALTPPYARQAIENLLGANRFSRFLCDTLRIPERAAKKLVRRQNLLLNQCTAAFANTNAQIAEMKPFVPMGNVHRLRRGLARDIFFPQASDAAWRARLKLAPHTPLLLFAGRVDASKGLPLLCDALRILKARGQEFHLMIAGKGDGAAYLHGLQDCVSALGQVSQKELAALYAVADLFPFPSQSETFGNVVLEAMACGCPPLVPAGTAPAEMVAPLSSACIIKEQTPQAWADAIERLLQNQALLKALREKAIAAAASWPDWAGVLQEDLWPVWAKILQEKTLKTKAQ